VSDIPGVYTCNSGVGTAANAANAANACDTQGPISIEGSGAEVVPKWPRFVSASNGRMFMVFYFLLRENWKRFSKKREVVKSNNNVTAFIILEAKSINMANAPEKTYQSRHYASVPVNNEGYT
jgi:hypothetical protein